MDILTIGEVLVEFVKKNKDSPHYERGEYVGPFPSGAPAIFVDTGARLGMKTGIVGGIGNDEFGKVIKDRLEKDKVDTRKLLVFDGITTGIAFVMYFSSGERRFVFTLKQSAAAQVRPEHIEEDFVKETKVVHVMGSALSLNENMREACYKAVRIASQHGLIVTYDPNLRAELIEPSLIRKISEPILRVAELVMPSKNELFDLTGKKSIEEAADEVLKYGVKQVVVKLGNEGSFLLTKDKKHFEPAYEVDEKDPTGAGDAFDAGYIMMYLKGKDYKESLKFANAVGAIKVTNFGPMEVPNSLREVEEFMKNSKQKVAKEHF